MCMKYVINIDYVLARLQLTCVVVLKCGLPINPASTVPFHFCAIAHTEFEGICLEHPIDQLTREELRVKFSQLIFHLLSLLHLVLEYDFHLTESCVLCQ